jgi:predicted phage tail protein
MKVTVLITKPLQSFISKSSIDLEVFDYSDILSALKELFPAFKKFLSVNRQIRDKYQDVCLVQNSKVIDLGRLRNKIQSEEPVYITPIIFGGAPTYGTESSNYYNNMKSSFMYPLFGLSTATLEQMDLEGLNKRIADSSLFGRAENIYDVDIRTDNDIFGGLKLTNIANLPVPLAYGEVRTAGNLINSYIATYKTNPDFFKVTDIMNPASHTYNMLLSPDYILNGYVDPDYVL